MRNVYIVGTSCTTFGRLAERSFQDLAREAYLGALADAGLPDGGAIEQAWFGNCGMGAWGQGGIRGQVCFTPLVQEGLFPERVPMVNVESGCATAIDQLKPELWHEYYAAAGAEAGKPFETGPNRTVFMDTYAMQAAWHMKRHGTTQRQIAIACSKNHKNGSLNPKAQYRFEVSVEEVLADRPVSFPLTRAMCSPIGDGAATARAGASPNRARARSAAAFRSIHPAASFPRGIRWAPPACR